MLGYFSAAAPKDVRDLQLFCRTVYLCRKETFDYDALQRCDRGRPIRDELKFDPRGR